MPNKINWTPEQREGITTVDKSLLVSAAAGSGKTTVLAQRCAHLICNGNCSVDELLVVTFTELAAAEMKARIQKALAERHHDQPCEHTTRQLAMVDRAAVSTLHGFCSRLLKQHFHLVGLDPNFIILDQDETALLKLEVARELFARRYDEEDADAFRSFIDCYGEGRDESLVSLIVKAHDTLTSVLDPRRWMAAARQRIAQAADSTFARSELGGELQLLLTQRLVALSNECNQSIKSLQQSGRFESYVKHLGKFHLVLQEWITVLQKNGLDALVSEAGSFDIPDTPRVPNSLEGKKAAKDRVDSICKEMKEGSLRKWLSFTTDQWQQGLRDILPHVDTFLSLVLEFDTEYRRSKDDEGALDFSDLEQFTLRVLRDGDEGLKPSAVARAYHRQFKHVLVDEYQDINEVQDAILTLLSHECLFPRPTAANLFCVGDVKQSIYGFRLAEPARFLAKRDEYSKPKGHGKVIDLQQNFRSREPLLEAINSAFERLMTAQGADVDYDQSQRLKPGQSFGNAQGDNIFTGAPIELHLLPKDADTGDDEDRCDREAAFCAQRILELTKTMQVIDRSKGTPEPRPLRFNDIVILLRSMQYKADQFAEGLRDAGIPVHTDSSTGYFEATEINDVLSLLTILDNQQQDIPLAAFLRSPLAGLPDAENNLARIAVAYHDHQPPVPFHDCVRRYAQEKDDELSAHLRDLLKRLDDWRKLARRRPLAQVLWNIYDETGYLAFCAGLRGGEQRQANLIELHERARQFASFRRQGLSRFLQFLQKLKKDSDLGQASIASDAQNVVRIMSIHRSKGLEFPVVFLPDLGKKFNLSDSTGAILLDRKSGLGLKVVDEERQVQYPSLPWFIVQHRLKQQALAEELRVLYVAMTRAKESLILCGTCAAAKSEDWRESWREHKGPLPVETFLSACSMLDWLGPAATASGPRAFNIISHTPEELQETSRQQSVAPVIPENLMSLQPLDPPPPPESAAQDVIDRVCQSYAFKPFSETAAAESVTHLAKKTEIEFASNSSAAPSELDRILPRPSFLLQEGVATATEKGTATHAVLEHLDFTDVADLPAITRQIEKMTRSLRITPQQASCVDLATIEWLLNEKVGQMLRDPRSKRHLELPVYFALPADDARDQVMVRGRLDALIETENGLVIIDYKTDRVSGELLEKRADFYRPQLLLYRDAIQRIAGKPVVAGYLLFLDPRQCRRVW